MIAYTNSKHLPKFSWKTILKKISIAILVLVTIFLIDEYKNSHFFPIKSVKIFGIQHINHDQLQQLLLPYVSKGFFGVDIGAIRERLLSLPWVANATVR